MNTHTSGVIKAIMTDRGTPVSGTMAGSSNAIFFDYSRDGKIFLGGEAKGTASANVTDSTHITYTVSYKSALKFAGKFAGTMTNNTSFVMTQSGVDKYSSTINSVYTIVSGGRTFTKTFTYAGTPGN